MQVDLHMHSSCSDGTLSPAQVMERARQQGLEIAALTDHDTLAGIAAAGEACGGVKLLTGLEITCAEQLWPGMDQPLSIHLLGYGFDPRHPALTGLLEKRNRAVEEVWQQLAQGLEQLGWHLPPEQVPRACGVVLQLSDFERELRSRPGPALEEALALVEATAEPLTRANIPAAEGIAAIHQAGGLAIWAHPLEVYRKFRRLGLCRTEAARLLDSLQPCGLDGWEAEYKDFDLERRRWLRRAARERGILFSAGSDFHGCPGGDRMGLEIQLLSGEAFVVDRLTR